MQGSLDMGAIANRTAHAGGIFLTICLVDGAERHRGAIDERILLGTALGAANACYGGSRPGAGLAAKRSAAGPRLGRCTDFAQVAGRPWDRQDCPPGRLRDHDRVQPDAH